MSGSPGLVTPRLVESLAARSEVEAALARLPAAQREAFLLHYLEEMSYAEIAEMTGVGESALKMRVKRACDRLREMIDND
jgi:RNA polymerase sigma-70 factor (ECF subfamily)